MRTSAVAYRADVPCGRKADHEELSVVETIVGWRGSLRGILSQLKSVAPTNTTVLLAGETGTGKEVIARAIHELIPHRNRNLVKVNCAAMATGLLESELFGDERGAFGHSHRSLGDGLDERHSSSFVAGKYSRVAKLRGARRNPFQGWVFEPAKLGTFEPVPAEISNPMLEDKVRQEILAACQRANWKIGGPRGEIRVEAHYPVLQNEEA